LKKELLILGPSPFNKSINHAGGQLSAITNLVKYLDQTKISYDIIDTFRRAFPPLSTKDKVLNSFIKYQELKDILNKNEYKGALIFASYGLGFWEKIFFSFLIQSYNTKTLFFIRSGHFMQSVINKNYKVPIKSFLLSRVSYIGYQGGAWENFYAKLGIPKDKLIKILNWIEVKNYKKEFSNSQVTFLYIGWIVKEKGVLELIDTILENKDLEKFKFIFIGGGTLLNELKGKVKLANCKNIEFTGWLKPNEVNVFYKKADALILPSHAEGFPNVVLEALNFRLPIIATDVGGIGESVKDNYNGFLIDINDKKALYKSIKKLGDSKSLREDFSKRSENILIKNHSIEKNCNKIFNLFGIEILFSK